VIAIADHPEGCVLPVRAQPGARKAGAQGEHNGALKLAVSAPPEDGRANKAILELVGELLGVRRSQVELVSGATGRDKRLLIRGVLRNELAARVAALLEGGRS
jgi:uncharacterized protein